MGDVSDSRRGSTPPTQVTANPELRGVVVSGANALPQRVVTDAFRHQHGKTLNFTTFNAALNHLNSWSVAEDAGSTPARNVLVRVGSTASETRKHHLQGMLRGSAWSETKAVSHCKGSKSHQQSGTDQPRDVLSLSRVVGHQKLLYHKGTKSCYRGAERACPCWRSEFVRRRSVASRACLLGGLSPATWGRHLLGGLDGNGPW